MAIDSVPYISRSTLRKMLWRLGIDRAVAYVVIGRGWTTIAGAVSLIFVARLLSPVEQGFYYTFASILGLQVFFELGLTYVMMQVASHERARLEWTEQGTLAGDAIAKGRLASLLRLALRWYGVVAALMLLMVLPAGCLFFARNQGAVSQAAWLIPWIWLAFSSAGALYLSPLFSILEGCGLVAEVAAMRMLQSLSSNLMLWVALALRGGLYAAPIYSTAVFACGAAWLLHNKLPFFRDLLSTPADGGPISWRTEIWPFQWKIALSWLSGYFIFNLFTPILFASFGPAAAGQMGMSISIATTPAAIALAWVTTKAAPFGVLVARREFRSLDEQFGRCLRQSLVVAGLGELLLWAAVYCLYASHSPFAHRILPPLPFGLLVIATVCNHLVAAEATYLRAYKQEPFLIVAIINGLLIGVFSYLLGRIYGPLGMMSVYAAVTLIVGCLGGTSIFLRKKRIWQRVLMNEAEAQCA